MNDQLSPGDRIKVTGERVGTALATIHTITSVDKLPRLEQGPELATVQAILAEIGATQIVLIEWPDAAGQTLTCIILALQDGTYRDLQRQRITIAPA